jgi:hypothetical protein
VQQTRTDGESAEKVDVTWNKEGLTKGRTAMQIHLVVLRAACRLNERGGQEGSLVIIGTGRRNRVRADNVR